MILRGIDRLAASELETFSYLNLPQSASKEKSDINWPRRLRNHCTYMMKNLQGRDVYEMWLKTSVGEGHSHGRGFSEFLCFGEGMFSDCVDRDRVIDVEGNTNWPGGDDPEEDELYEVESCYIEIEQGFARFTFSAVISKPLELKRSYIPL